MKRGKLVAIIVSGVLLLATPITLVSVGFGAPSVFQDTYYGELSEMFFKLKHTSGKKVVFVGNSAVAFGINSDLVGSELVGYKVVNLGLYGAIGTRTMIDLSKANINEGDIVVVCPEPYKQTSSLYFSAKEMWRAADSDFSMLQMLPYEQNGYMVGAFPGYVAEKIQYSSSEEKPMNTGVYSRSAFKRENGQYADYVVADRPYNMMGGGYDGTNLPLLSKDVFGEGFLDYLNDYASFVKDRKASLYFGFCPLNSLSLGDNKAKDADDFYDYLDEKLNFPLLGHPAKYFFDYRFFYDNNVHMNSAGMSHYTSALVEDLKLELGLPTKNSIPLAEPPEIPADTHEDGDNSDLDKFELEIIDGEVERYARIKSLSEAGKAASILTLPSTYEGVPVREFDATVFQNNKTVSRIVLPSNIHSIYDRSFYGATRLSELYFRHDSILGMSVGVNFLEGADNCYIYIKKNVSVADCAGGWERYESRIRYY